MLYFLLRFKKKILLALRRFFKLCNTSNDSTHGEGGWDWIHAAGWSILLWSSCLVLSLGRTGEVVMWATEGT